MLEKVRKIKVMIDLDGIFEKGEILYEFYDYPGHFYRDGHIEDVIILKTIIDFSPYKKWFKELKPVKKENTPPYKLLVTK